MTSRPAVQRSLSGNHSNNVLQRPAQHRSLSQQYPTLSPTRRNNSEGFVDLTLEPGDTAQGRYGSNAASRMGGSRLKLEITKDPNNSGPSVLDSPMQVLEAPAPWRPCTPLRGRPLLHTDVTGDSSRNLLGTSSAQDGQPEVLIVRHMPLPVRPGQHKRPPPHKSKSSPANLAKKDARPKPYVFEVPASAPHYSPNGHSDFFPWTGDHPEDQFSEAVIRQGFFDKTQMTLNETGSAKTTLFPALKHKTGLQTLSSLFTGVLAQRRAYGQINSTSTFKPPPRVTVTDTKREMWLKDLANPTTSLRRLSRSIPHGIRGKVLLDQSLSKNIPVERAVWLAKCVGANELRSFRRKGTSGAFTMGSEAKWIRDFTVCVEQFLEGIIASCAERDFRSRIYYAIRLSTHFHAEYLLDREHYMDWLVSSLENSPQAKLPMWLLITQIYWVDLLKYRKYARRLSTALLEHFKEAANHEDHDILAPLVERLKVLLKDLIKTKPESFVSPRLWAKHHTYIKSHIEADDEQYYRAVAVIDLRNRRLLIHGKEREPTSRQRLIQDLDQLLWRAFTSDLPIRLWKLSDNKAVLLRTVLEWSTSAHRPGFSKVFIGVRIIRTWSKFGAAVTESILSFIDSAPYQTGQSRTALYHLISELTRSQHFSTPTYLQWLIARGGLSESSELDQEGPCATRLLAELPTHSLSNAMTSLRRTLLCRAGFDVDQEEDDSQALMVAIERSLTGMQATASLDMVSQRLPPGDVSRHISTSSRTIKSELGLWLRDKVSLHMAPRKITTTSDDWSIVQISDAVSPITVSDFSIIRQYLELIEDYSMLADVLKLVSSSHDADVLASIADSVDLHIDIFSAIGASRDLFEVLLNRLRSLSEEHGSFPRVLLASMSSLATRVSDQKVVAQQLSEELARSDRKTAADACSPVSDHIAGVLQTEEADFTDELEKILASGTSMDQATLERLFQRIITRFEESWGKSSEQQRSCGLLLTRLRTFDTVQFDHLLVGWVHRFQYMRSRPSMTDVLAPLISFGCLDLKDVLATERYVSGGNTSEDDFINSRISREALALLILPANIPELMTAEESYRLRVKQTHVQHNQPVQTLDVLRRALETPIDQDGSITIPTVSRLLGHPITLSLLQRLVVVKPEFTNKHLILPLCQNFNSNIAAILESLTDNLLLPERKCNQSEMTPIQADAVLGLASDLTLPFCQLKLSSILGANNTASVENEGAHVRRLEAFEHAIEVAVARGNTTWASIIPLLDVSIAQRLRSRAETQFLSLFPSPKSPPTYTTSDNEWRIRQAKTLLFIITVTADGSGPATSTALAADIVGALNHTWLLLTSTTHAESKRDLVTEWFPLLVSFTIIHISAFEVSRAGQEFRAKALLALAALMLELEAITLSSMPTLNLMEQIFDLSLVLVDPLPDDMRQQCIRGLRDAMSNPRISYIFSITKNPSEYLMLSQRDKTSTVSSVQAGPTNSLVGVSSGEVRSVTKEKLVHFPLRRWEMLGVGSGSGCENDTSLSLTLFGARRS